MTGKEQKEGRGGGANRAKKPGPQGPKRGGGGPLGEVRAPSAGRVQRGRARGERKCGPSWSSRA